MELRTCLTKHSSGVPLVLQLQMFNDLKRVFLQDFGGRVAVAGLS